MPTYLELASEAVYRAEITPVAMQDFLIVPLRNFYNMGPSLIGARGDNRHLQGRHRSRNWCLQSRYSTSRTYATTNPKDRRGNGDWLRAIDIGIRDQVLQAACRRLDLAVRSGQVPGVAEWFGTFDGQHVVGWFEGRPGSSDDSHLWHLHVGIWTESANDPVLMRTLYAVITGTEVEDDMITVVEDNARPGVYYLWDGLRFEQLIGPINDVGFVLSGRWPTGDPNGAYGTWMSKVVINERIGVEPWLNIPKLPISVLAVVPEPVGSVELSDEQLAEVAAAAEAGAVSGAPTHEELVASAEEGANLAEDS